MEIHNAISFIQAVTKGHAWPYDDIARHEIYRKGGVTIKRCNCGCTKRGNDFGREYAHFEHQPDAGCYRPVKKYLEPVLVARIYNQQIVEEMPYSAMSMTMDNTTCISGGPNARPVCEDCGSMEDCNGDV